MSEPDGWSTPEGWGPGGQQPANGKAPGYGQQPGPVPATGYGQQPGYGPAPPYGQAPGTPGAPSSWGQQPGQWGDSQQWGGPQPWGRAPLDVKPGIVPLRPLGLGEILDGAVGIIRRYPRPALGLSAIVAAVTAVLNVVVQLLAFRPLLTLDQSALQAGDTAALQDALGSLFAGGALAVVVSLLSTAVMTGAITAVVGKAVLGQPLTFGEVLRTVRARLLPLLALSLLTLLAIYGAVVLGVALGAAVIALGGAVLALVGVPLILVGIVAAIYLYGRWSLAPCALVLERTGVLASLRRSSTLVKRDWWRVFGILVLTIVIGGFVSGIIQVPFGVFGAGSISSLFDPQADPLSARALVAGAIGGTLAATLITPFTTGVRALLYVDRRMRAEGLDVALTSAAGSQTGP